MNAMTKVAPELTVERLEAVVKTLPLASSLPDAVRERIYLTAWICERELETAMQQPETGLFLPSLFGWAHEPFGDPDGSEDEDANPWDHPWEPWADRVCLADPPLNPWNHLLDEAERLIPGWSRWDLPGARIGVVGAPPAPLQVWSDDGEDEDAPELEWLVPGLIPAHSIACFVGEPAQGKSSMALLLAVQVTAGLPFAGREVRQGVVAYVAAEGHPRALQARIRAMRAAYGVAAGGTRIAIINGADKSLCRPGDVDSLVATIAAHTGGQPVRAVILDTYSQLMTGQDLNGDGPTSQAVASISRIRDAFSTAVVVIAHPAGGGYDPRGCRALKQAIDALFYVSAKRKDGGVETVTMENTKQRDTRLAPNCVFDAAPDPSAFVPIYREADATAALASAAPKPKVSAKAKLALAFLTKHGPATEAAWRAGVAGQITGSANAASQRTAFARVRAELESANVVEIGDGGLWRTTV